MSRRASRVALLPYLLFGVSGFAALLYEVVWTRRLVLLFGATIDSVSVILAGFMGGLALGAVWGGRLARRTRDPLALYGRLELGVAATAAAFPLVLAGLSRLQESAALPFWAKAAVVFAALLPPTALMGATFPALAQAGGAERVAGLYAANLAGACLGVLLGAFVFLAFLGLSGTQAVAVALSAGAGLAALLTGSREADRGPVVAKPAVAEPPTAHAPAGISATVFVSGACGMAFEVAWTRLLLPAFNNSAYGFASVLFVFLAGLGLGSWAAGRVRRVSLPGLGAALAAAGVLGLASFSVFELAQVLMIRFSDLRAEQVHRPLLLVPLAQAAAVLGPLAVLQGMCLPLAVRLAVGDGPAGAAVSRLYAANTLGSIFGSLAAGFWWLPAWGAQNALMLTASLAAVAGCVAASLAAPRTLRYGLAGRSPAVPALAGAIGVAGLPAAAACAMGLVWAWTAGRDVPARLLADWNNRHAAVPATVVRHVEDREASVGVIQQGRGRFLVINGFRVTGFTNVTKMLAHIPMLLHPAPERTLVICFGMGTTYRSALRHGGRVEAVELVGAVLDAFPHFFHDAERWLREPRGRLVVGDGRNHLLSDREGYDVILVDPSPPLYAAGTVNLYSRDFFALARRRLKPGGILAVWLPACPEDEFRMILKGFLEAFPHSEYWRATRVHKGLVMLGGESPLPRDRSRVERRWRSPELEADLREFDGEFASPATFWSLYEGDAGRYRGALADAKAVTDDYPWLEYPYFRSKSARYLREPALLQQR